MVFLRRFVPESKPDNSHLAECAKVTKNNRGIDGSAKCGSDVRFTGVPEIEANVIIGHGCEFGTKLEVGKGAQLGNFVVTERNVVIGQYVCVKDKTLLPVATSIKDYAKVEQNSDSSLKITMAADDKKFVLKNGDCVEENR